MIPKLPKGSRHQQLVGWSSKGTARAVPFLLAVVLDQVLGDPPNRYHPVAWMGKAIAAAERHAPRQGRLAPLIHGTLLTTVGATVIGGLGYVGERVAARLPLPWRWLVEAGLFKITFSRQGLASAAGEVQAALATGDLPEARRLVRWHLVSRATDDLDEAQVAAATIESVAENSSDGVIAPWLYYAWGGLPAALAYRFINTVDAMLGYHDQRHEWLGKVPARLDDLVNLLPARLTASLLVLAAPLAGAHPRRAWRVLRRDGEQTASPNAGWPMSAMAGALGVKLEKAGQYRLGAGLGDAKAGDIGRAVRLMRLGTVLAAGVLVVFMGARSRP